MSVFEELKRRNVFKVGAAYLVGSWLLIQFADIILDNYNTPEWAFTLILVVLTVGFFVTLFVAWAFEVTPEGILREADVDRSARGRCRSITIHRATDRQETEQRHRCVAGAGSGLLALRQVLGTRLGVRVKFSGREQRAWTRIFRVRVKTSKTIIIFHAIDEAVISVC